MRAAMQGETVQAGRPAVSVVIPTRHRLASLLRVVHALELQDQPRELMEIVVVVDGDPHAAAALAGQGSLRVVEQAHRGASAARNLGLAHARGDLVVFIDDDVVPAPWCLRRHAEAHRGRDDVVVCGPLLPNRDAGASPWVRWEAQTLQRQYADMEAGLWAATPRQFYSGNASVRREHLVRAGGFDVSLRRGEDVELGFRLADLGLTFEYHPELTAHHEACRAYAAWVGGAREYGRVAAEMALSKGRAELLEATAAEFHERHPLTRIAVRVGLRRALFRSMLPWLVAPAAHTALRCRLGAVSDALCGGVFDVLFWQGVSERMGGASQARALIAAQAVRPSATA